MRIDITATEFVRHTAVHLRIDVELIISGNERRNKEEGVKFFCLRYLACTTKGKGRP